MSIIAIGIGIVVVWSAILLLAALIGDKS